MRCAFLSPSSFFVVCTCNYTFCFVSVSITMSYTTSGSMIAALSDSLSVSMLVATSHTFSDTIAAVRIIHRITQSVGATGGVHKGQGRNQHELMTRAYQEVLVED